MLHYTEIAPPESLKRFINCYWKFRNDSDSEVEHYTLPELNPFLVYFSMFKGKHSGIVLNGPSYKVTKRTIPPFSEFFGVRFQPLITNKIFSIDGIEFREKLPSEIELGEFSNCVGQTGEELFNSLNIIIGKNTQNINYKEKDKVILDSIDLIKKDFGRGKVSDIVSTLPISERVLQKSFKKMTGLTMKEYIIILRLRLGMIRLELEGTKYQDMLYETGYFDQAHFIRDFNKLSEISLPDFKKYIKNIRHENVSIENYI